MSSGSVADDYELQASVRTPDIQFESDTDIGLWARFHFAIHTADFDSTREFYRNLGFTQGISGFLVNQYIRDGSRTRHV